METLLLFFLYLTKIVFNRVIIGLAGGKIGIERFSEVIE